MSTLRPLQKVRVRPDIEDNAVFNTDGYIMESLADKIVTISYYDDVDEIHNSEVYRIVEDDERFMWGTADFLPAVLDVGDRVIVKSDLLEHSATHIVDRMIKLAGEEVTISNVRFLYTDDGNDVYEYKIEDNEYSWLIDDFVFVSDTDSAEIRIALAVSSVFNHFKEKY